MLYPMAYLKSTPEISHLKFQLKFLKFQPLILDFKKSVKPDARSVHIHVPFVWVPVPVYAGCKYMLVLGSARVASVGASARVANREISFEIFGS